MNNRDPIIQLPPPKFGRVTGSLLALVTTARGTGSNFHVSRYGGWTRTKTSL